MTWDTERRVINVLASVLTIFELKLLDYLFSEHSSPFVPWLVLEKRI